MGRLAGRPSFVSVGLGGPAGGGIGSTQLRPRLVSGGTFVVDNSGSATVTMTTGVDPRQFRIMEITAEAPGNRAIRGMPLLTGKTL